MTLLYPDVSNNNWGDENLTDQGQQNLMSFLSQLQPQGFAGVAHKMSQGNSYIDPYGALCQTWCSQNTLPFIGYHFLDTSDPNSQAQNWLAAGGATNVMFDWEAGGGSLANFWAAVNAFNSSGINVQLGYDPRWYLEGAGDGAGTDISAFVSGGILLISSAYPLGSQAGYASDLYVQCGGDTGEGWTPYDNGPVPSAWQFTSSANIGGFTNVDCNAYRGTDLNVLFGTTPAAPVVVTPPPPPPVSPPPPTTPPVSTYDPNWTMPTDEGTLALVASSIVGDFMGTGVANAD